MEGFFMDILRQKRLVLIFSILFLCFLGLVAQLWRIQIKNGELYACLALEQGSIWVSLEESPRGKILDRNLVPLTGGKTENRVVVFPQAVEDKTAVSRGLAEILAVDEAVIKRCLDGGACCLPYSLTAEQTELVRQKGWTGIMVQPVQFRYNENSLASQTIGHLGKVSSYAEYFSLVSQWPTRRI
jgi:penicillin-binding protein 2